jgi:hypothetical protein
MSGHAVGQLHGQLPLRQGAPVEHFEQRIGRPPDSLVGAHACLIEGRDRAEDEKAQRILVLGQHAPSEYGRVCRREYVGRAPEAERLHQRLIGFQGVLDVGRSKALHACKEREPRRARRRVLDAAGARRT